jgi:imidazolonepropionase-like amidohydrolase
MEPHRVILFTGFFIALGLTAPQAAPQRPVTSIVITHVTVIDTHGGPPERDMTVVVQGRRIEEVEKSRQRTLWSGDTVIDGRGKFLIPGLWDMEVHLSWTTVSALPLLVANGVTDVRDMGGDFREIEKWRTMIASGLMLGPHILQVGPMLNGKSFNQYQLATGTPEETRAIVRTLKFLGVDGLEIERRISRDPYFALIDQAKHGALWVGGHVPLSMRPEEVSNAGQTTIDNVESLYDGTFAEGIERKDVPDAIQHFLGSGDSDVLFRVFAKNHTAVTPVLGTFAWSLRQLSPGTPPDPNSRYVALSLRNQFAKTQIPSEELDTLNREIPQLLATVYRMRQDGVMLLAGTDIAAARIPGFSLHAELQELVAAGLSPLEAIQTATLNPAIALGKTNDFGSIEAGKTADMLLLDADPLADIRNTQRIVGVVIDGKLLRRTDLDGLLRDVELLANQN